ncbi:MAG: ATP synthase A1 subunit C [Thermoplasmata archaeon]|nr:ATP synthase A1 subunit C [Thermoplasmata archaeon]
MKFGRTTSNYPYACTRVRAKRRFLIQKDEYLRLSVMDLPSINRYIGDSQYKTEIEALSSEYRGADLVERATNANLALTYNQIMSFCEGQLGELVSHYLGKVDAWNVKTLLRGRFHKAEADVIIRELIPSGTIRIAKLEELARVGSIPEIIDGLKGTPYHVPLEKVMRTIGEGATISSLILFENEIDKAYYATLLASASSTTSRSTTLFMNFVKKEIDIENLTTLMKIKFDLILHDKGIDNAEDYIIPGGGELKGPGLKALLVANSYQQFVGELQRFSFYDDIAEAAENAEEKMTLSDMTRAAEKHLLRQADKFAKVYPLSVLPILNYLILKKIEVDNMRIIARGKESGLDVDTIRGLLVV